MMNVGFDEGDDDSSEDGKLDGVKEGSADGIEDSDSHGLVNGDSDGTDDGGSEGSQQTAWMTETVTAPSTVRRMVTAKASRKVPWMTLKMETAWTTEQKMATAMG